MYYKGNNINLEQYVEEMRKDYENKPLWMWEDEGIIYAIMDYFSSTGEFSDSDADYINAIGFSVEDFATVEC